MNIKELIATNLLEYEKIAISLSSNRSYLNEINEKINNPSNRDKLFDEKIFTFNYEEALKEIVKIKKEGLPNQDIRIFNNKEI